MAEVFSAKAQGTQSSDAKILTLKDDSNWTTNTDGKIITNFTRSFEIKDSSGDVIQTIPLTGSNLTADVDVPKDRYYSVKLIVDGATDYSDTINLGLDRYTTNAYDNLLKGQCGCKGIAKIKQRLSDADNFIFGSENALQFGNGPAFDEYISNAYSVLTSY